MLQISEEGKTLLGEKLTEDNLLGSELVIFQDELFLTGNRKSNRVELYELDGVNSELRFITDMHRLRVVNKKINR